MIEIWHSQVRHSDESQLAYNEIYAGSGIHLLDSFYLWLLSLIRPQPGKRLLDVSCGEGALAMWSRRQGIAAYGIDFSSVAIRRAYTKTGMTAFLVGDGTRLPFPDEGFDYVTCIGSLEHYEQPALGMREIGRALHPDGTACILLPNTFSLFGNINYARKHGDAFDDGQPIQRYHSRVGWAGMLEQNGLRVTRTEKYEMVWPRTHADRLWYLRRPAKIAHLALAGILPLNLANCFVYLCAKA